MIYSTLNKICRPSLNILKQKMGNNYSLYKIILYGYCITKDQTIKQRYNKIKQISNIPSRYHQYNKLVKEYNENNLTPPIPGLIYYHNFAEKETINNLQQYCYRLYGQLLNKYQSKPKDGLYKCYNHNLSTDKSYKLINIQDITANIQKIKNVRPPHNIDAQMFKDYGSEGHDLTYFIDNKNIPYFVKNILVSKLQQLQQVKKVQEQKIKSANSCQNIPKAQQQLNWRLTFNVYKQNKESQTAFLWHKDIPVNGIITSIMTVKGQGYFQIKHQNPQYQEYVYKMLLQPGSLVVLSGDARWKWVHRVKRIKQEIQNQDHTIQRISLVLGCK